MLKTLTIENYALIEQAHIDLSHGFTVITGETGAGKSILLGALGLITGKRADISSIGNADRKCIVEAGFMIEKYELQTFFEQHDLDYDVHTIIRRELLPTGKSRAFINDTPVTLQQLSQLGESLVDIHSQHKTLEILSKSYQFDMLDTYANNMEHLSAYQIEYRAYQKTIEEYESLVEQQKKLKLEADYNTFLFNELNEAAIKPDEYEIISEQHKSLSHYEEIKEQLSFASHKLQEDDLGILDQINQIRQGLSSISAYGANFQSVYDRLNSIYIELEDLSEELTTLVGTSETDPQTLEDINQRLTMLYGLLQKHQVSTTQDLIEIYQNLDEKLQEVFGIKDTLTAKELKISQLKKSLEVKAETLHKKRKAAIPKLIMTLQERTRELSMEHAKFDITLSQTESFTDKGKNDLILLFSANKGMDLKPLNKGASGGELSRVLLAIKAVLSMHKELPTLIFDEIDTGVSGEVAVKMGTVLKSMSSAMQLLCITHLPQIAGQGTSHFKVYKKVQNARTLTTINELNPEGRVEEIALMLGGLRSSEAVLEHARSLLRG